MFRSQFTRIIEMIKYCVCLQQESRKANHAEVAEEDRKSKLPRNWESRKRRQDYIVEEDDQRKVRFTLISS